MNFRRLAALQWILFGSMVFCGFLPLSAQDEDAAAEEDADRVPPSLLIEIPEEPKVIDPAQFMPEELAKPVSGEFENWTLEEIAKWVTDQSGMPVLIDKEALQRVNFSQSDYINDELNDEPLYLLLDRLKIRRVSWYLDGGVIWFTSDTVATYRLATESFVLTDLIDAGYTPDVLIDLIMKSTAGPWMEVDAEGGTLEMLADVLFVRARDMQRRQVAALLQGLRRHGRQTVVFDPPQHAKLRGLLHQPVTVDFDHTPLTLAVDQLSKSSGADIRLDLPALANLAIRDREPVTLALEDRSLETVLRVMLADTQLTWGLEYGVLWITGDADAERMYKTAIYDVRDLCTSEAEADALASAVQTQTGVDWLDIDARGGTIAFPKPGVMVVRQNDRGLQEVSNLLEQFRVALKSSKPRPKETESPDDIVVRYYQMNQQMALDLETNLPILVKPGTWKDEDHPDVPGTIYRNASIVIQQGEDYVPQTALIIRQTRAAQEEIRELIQNIVSGVLPQQLNSGGMGGGGGAFGGGMGGGGFGGGYFSTAPRPAEKLSTERLNAPTPANK